jgi:hypothetical protein
MVQDVFEKDFNEEIRIKTSDIQALKKELKQLHHDLVADAKKDGFIKSNKRCLFFKKE